MHLFDFVSVYNVSYLATNRFKVIYAFAYQWHSKYFFSGMPMQSPYKNLEQMSDENIWALSIEKMLVGN